MVWYDAQRIRLEAMAPRAIFDTMPSKTISRALLVPGHHDSVGDAILVIRDMRVILAADLAALYGVSTKALNQAVRRNLRRFPPDFAFKLTRQESADIQRLRSQSVTLKRGAHFKYSPVAFTEHGAVMVATVLNSRRAVQMSVFVVRAFLKLREWSALHVEVSRRLADLEQRVSGHDEDLKVMISAVRRLLSTPAPPRRRIGFITPNTTGKRRPRSARATS